MLPPGAIGYKQYLVFAETAGSRPDHPEFDIFLVLHVRENAFVFHPVRRHEQESHAALRNHSTACASATSAGPGLKPSSRRAFSCVTHIFFFAIRTGGCRAGA